MSAPWTRTEASASGQVFEFRLWAALTEQSRGQLHVFLPLSDRGIDAIIHRLSDGAYIPVQAIGRSIVEDGDVHLFVWADSVADDSVLIVAGQIVEGGLGPALLAVPAPDCRRLAEVSTVNGRPVYSMAFGTNLRFHSRWMPWFGPDRPTTRAIWWNGGSVSSATPRGGSAVRRRRPRVSRGTGSHPTPRRG